MADKLRVDLSGAPLTMLATLYAKALDVDLPRPILGDRWAKDIVGRLDYDWSQTTITARTSPSVTTRTAHFDTWTRQFLDAHPKVTVLHLGCGLDSRYLRIGPGPDVEWYDVDYPTSRRYGPNSFRSGNTTMSSPHPTREDGLALLRRVVDRFPSGELQFDAFNRLGIKTQWSNRVVTRAGATLRWYIDGPDEILEAVPGTRLLAWISVFESETLRTVSGSYRLLGKAMAVLPALR